MHFFSLTIFKKTLEKKFLYPTAILTLVVLELIFTTDALLGSKPIGKNSLALAISFPFFISALILFKALIKNKMTTSLKETVLLAANEGTKFALATLMLSMFFLSLMLVGNILYGFEQVPAVGAYLKIFLCVGSFFVLLLEKLSLVTSLFLAYAFSCLSFTKKTIDLKSIYLEVQEVFSKNSMKLMSFFKAAFPLLLISGLTFSTKNQILASDQGGFKVLYEMVLAFPMSLILAPFVTYFFLVTQILEEKFLLKDLRMTQSSLAR